MNSASMYNELRRKAQEASRNAYCKYSGFAVGAALLTESGQIFTGCNVENGSYPVGICAERVAFSKAVSEGHTKFQAVAIYGGETPCPPCGMCRQFMAEFCHDNFEIILTDKIYTLKELLPVRFDFK